MPGVSVRFVTGDLEDPEQGRITAKLSQALGDVSADLNLPLELDISGGRCPSGYRLKVEIHLHDLVIARGGEGSDAEQAAETAAAALKEVMENHGTYLKGYTGRTPVMELNIQSKLYIKPDEQGAAGRHFVKKLSPAEAMVELDLSNAPGRIFFNKETGRPSVMLNHKDGRFEILEPGEETTGGAGVETSLVDLGRSPEKAPEPGKGPKSEQSSVEWTGKLGRIRSALRCPACKGEVDDRKEGLHERLHCNACRRSYEIRSGVPIMILDDGHDPDPGESPVSRNPYGQQALQVIEKHAKGLVLDCGSGCPPACFENVVHLEIVRYPGVDVVADGAHLPFADTSFDAVISEAVLEHVPDPSAYVAELRRVLKPGGEIRADAAFLQPYHAYPHHYFNMTLSGLELLMKDFVKIDSGCGPHQQPLVTMGLVLGGILDGIEDPEKRARAGDLTLREALRRIDEETEKEPFQHLSREAVQKFAAGFYFYGYKE